VIGEAVTLASDTSAEPVVIGKVQDRYLDEHGDWAYSVHNHRYGTNPYDEADIAPVRR